MFNLFHQEGVDVFLLGEYEKAKQLFLKAIEEDPEVAKTYFFLGQACFLCEEKHEAIGYLRRFIDLSKEDMEEMANVSYAFDVLGNCYEGINDNNKAIECYEEAIKINPSSASAMHNLGLIYIKLALLCLEVDLHNTFAMFNQANQLLKNALTFCQDNPMFLQSMASWFEKYIEALNQLMSTEMNVQETIEEHFKRAIEYYQKALKACTEDDSGLQNIISDNLVECLAQYGHFLYQNEKYEDAQALYLDVIALDPDHLIGISQLGMALFKQDQFVEARNYFYSILVKTKEIQELADAWLNISCTYKFEKNWEQAEAALFKAKQLSPGDPTIVEQEAYLAQSKSQYILSSPNNRTLFGNAVLQRINNQLSDVAGFQL